MIMKMRRDKCHPGGGEKGENTPLPNNVVKKSANDAGPEQGLVQFVKCSLSSFSLVKQQTLYRQVCLCTSSLFKIVPRPVYYYH